MPKRLRKPMTTRMGDKLYVRMPEGRMEVEIVKQKFCPLYVPKEGTPIHSLIVRGSAVVGHEGHNFANETDEYVEVYFEGNINGAINLNTFDGKCRAAHTRMVVKYPTIAKADVPMSDLILVGGYDPVLGEYTVFNRPVFDEWCNEAKRGT